MAYSHAAPQRFHEGSVPRLGGLGMLLGWLVGMLLAMGVPALGLFNGIHLTWVDFALFALLGAVATAAGALEDVTQRVAVRWRLLLTAALGVYAVSYWGMSVPSVGVPLLDAYWQAKPLLGMALAVFGIMGLPHAFNIIDGYNGLAGTVALLVCVALAHVALQLGDRELAVVVLCLAAATAGFLVWNYPRGLVFAGDGGAYLVGHGGGAGEHCSGAAPPAGVSLVSSAVADLPGVGNVFFDVPQMGAGHLPWHGRRHAPAPAGLPPLGQASARARRSRPPAVPQQQNHPLPCRTRPHVGRARHAVLEPHTWVLQLFALLFVVSYVYAYVQPLCGLGCPGGCAGKLISTPRGAVAWCRLAQGVQLLYVSALSGQANQLVIRGGVPVLFPQFADRGPLKKHGFARDLPWQLVEQGAHADGHRLVCELHIHPADQPSWPHSAQLVLTALLTPNALHMPWRYATSAAPRLNGQVACTLIGLQPICATASCWAGRVRCCKTATTPTKPPKTKPSYAGTATSLSPCTSTKPHCRSKRPPTHYSGA
jgi:hypothetical protein